MNRARDMAVVIAAALALGACTTSDVLEPQAMVGQSAPAPAPLSAPAPIAPPVAEPPPADPSAVAAIPGDARLQFAPIIGATVGAVTPLTERLVARARERGITLAGSGDPATTHLLKGYFSAISEADGTTVIYVWDVVDRSGNRLHRIQGQQKVAGAVGESWDAVPPDTMRAIGDLTIDQFAVWLSARTP